MKHYATNIMPFPKGNNLKEKARLALNWVGGGGLVNYIIWTF